MTTAYRALPLALIAMSSAVAAQEGVPNDRPPVFQAVIDCVGISDPDARLRCYDTAVKALDSARAEKDIVIADREQVREAKRGLFGLSLPELKLFSNNEDRITEVQGTIASLTEFERGKWSFSLQDGARWSQIDSGFVNPKVGDPVRIREAAMGSYFANIGRGRAIRVRRVR